ncbi:hypothetical protein PtA15_5A807 [Puccinia triticina]|uniref:HMG box domain-containing protein n=1 Tax=Puccinia triticina TaxID=208348 RepID=A0ABY7CK05_9BASI|nr:uncharacterized protein PtA15_5A807 [Puccinia triticina]WAQ85233.1 hypothetical protein PtA15_5A807 [Puccinia triticina]
MMLAPHLVEELKTMDINELQQRVNKHAHYVRLCSADEVEIQEAYEEFQRQLLIIAASRRLQFDSVQSYLGAENRTQGSNMYTNFCRYDPKAIKIQDDKSLSIQEKGSKYGALWRELDEADQQKYKDPEFLATFPNPFVREPKTAEEASEDENIELSDAIDTAKNKSRKRRSGKGFDANCWARKVLVDLKNLEKSHAIEGYLVVVYPHLKGRAVLSGGSRMGESFLDMFEINPNPTGAFLDFVKGQLALGKVMGGEAFLPPQKRKRLAANPHLTIENCANDLGSPTADVAQCLGDTNEETLLDESNRVRVPVGAMPPSETTRSRKIQKKPTIKSATIKSAKPTNSNSRKEASCLKSKASKPSERQVVKEAKKKKQNYVSSRHADDKSASSTESNSEELEDDLFKGSSDNEDGEDNAPDEGDNERDN